MVGRYAEGGGGGVSATVTLGKNRRTLTDWQIDGEMEKKRR